MFRVASPIPTQVPFHHLRQSLVAIGLGFALSVGFTIYAKASTFNWSYSDLGASGGGTLTTGAASNGGSVITGITGTFGGGAISGLGGGFFADDILFPAAPLLDFDGLAFHATIMGIPSTVELFFVNAQQSFSSQAGYGFTTYPQSLEFCNDPDSCSSAGMRIEGIDIFARLDSGLSGQFEIVSATPVPGALPLMGTVLGLAYVICRRRKPWLNTGN
jgi:hypothetical protein